jgi:glucose-6-phosphate dehydrogenase assembly protein OpcA
MDLARLCASGQGVSDFNWARLAVWREIVAQFFDAPTLVPCAGGIRSIQIEFGAGGDNYGPATAGLLLLLGWLASQLGWVPESPLDGVLTRDATLALNQGARLIPIDVRFRDHGSQAAGQLMAMDIRSETDAIPAADFGFRRSTNLQHAEVRTEIGNDHTIERVVPVHVRSDIELLADQLETAGRDPCYRATVDMAARIAGREVWLPV